MAYKNPFKPTAGAEPPKIIGRDSAVMAFTQSLEEGVGSPARLMRISGPRGSGKTVLLNDLGDKAREHGWSVIDLTASPYLLDDLLYALSPNAEFVSASVTSEGRTPNLHDLMAHACSSSTGLAITIDEVQDAPLDSMRRIAQTVQLLIREKQNIALIFAGLPAGVMDVINGKALTFLRRAMSEELESINPVEIALSFGDSFSLTGFVLSSDQQSMMAQATGGYAFMIQLVGYYVWQRADVHRASSSNVTDRDIDEGLAIAQEQFHQLVHETALNGISKGAMEYLIAMAQDKRISSTAKIAKRIGRSPKLAGAYRHQLIQRQVIQPVRRGYVEFAIPFLADYIQNNKDELLLRY